MKKKGLNEALMLVAAAAGTGIAIAELEKRVGWFQDDANQQWHKYVPEGVALAGGVYGAIKAKKPMMKAAFLGVAAAGGGLLVEDAWNKWGTPPAATGYFWGQAGAYPKYLNAYQYQNAKGDLNPGNWSAGELMSPSPSPTPTRSEAGVLMDARMRY